MAGKSLETPYFSFDRGEKSLETLRRTLETLRRTLATFISVSAASRRALLALRCVKERGAGLSVTGREEVATEEILLDLLLGLQEGERRVTVPL
jgi:hypothetical protein